MKRCAMVMLAALAVAGCGLGPPFSGTEERADSSPPTLPPPDTITWQVIDCLSQYFDVTVEVLDPAFNPIYQKTDLHQQAPYSAQTIVSSLALTARITVTLAYPDLTGTISSVGPPMPVWAPPTYQDAVIASGNLDGAPAVSSFIINGSTSSRAGVMYVAYNRMTIDSAIFTGGEPFELYYGNVGMEITWSSLGTTSWVDYQTGVNTCWLEEGL